MHPLRVGALLFWLGIHGGRVIAQPSTAASDSARLQGTWVMVAGAASGAPMPAMYLSGMKRVAAGNEVTVTMGGQLFFKATFSLDPGQSPRTIDYHMTGGPTAGGLQLGIYEFRGDTVRFCFGPVGAPRPTEFATVNGDQRTLSSWVRTP